MAKYHQDGSFRGVPFIYLEDDYIFKQKEAEQNLLSQDTQTETLGAMPREFNLKVCVMGKEAVKKRNDLIKALEQEGSGILIHPQYGRMSVKIPQEGFTVSGSVEEGNYYTFSINFIKANEKTLRLSVVPVKFDKNEILNQTVSEALKTISQNFEKTLKTKGFLDFVAQDTRNFALKVVSKISEITSQELLPISTVQDIKVSLDIMSSSIGSLINQPDKLASDFIETLSIEGATYDLFKSLLSLSFFPSKPDFLTKNRQQAVQNQKALSDVLKQVVLVKALQTSTDMPISSKEMITERIEEITDLTQKAMDNDFQSNPEIVLKLERVLEAAVVVLKEKEPVSSTVLEITETIPSTVLLHKIGGVQTLQKNSDFAVKNKIRHPLFVKASSRVEVIL